MAKKKDLSFLEEQATPASALDEIMNYVRALETTDAEILTAEQQLDALKIKRDNLARTVLPMYLDQNGLEELKLSNGKKLSLKEDVYARLPADPFEKEDMLKWLEDHGGGAKITDKLIVEEPEDVLIDSLSEAGIAFSRDRTVNTQSLQAYFREMLGLKKGSVAMIAMEDIPKKFGVYVKREAKLSS